MRRVVRLMLFQNTDEHPHIAMLACGDKTETRRNSKRWQMKIGSIYAAHDASKGLFQKKMDALVFLRCLDIYEERLGDMSEKDACEEGQYTLEEFQELWIEINGEWNPDKVVTVYVVERMKCHSDICEKRDWNTLIGSLCPLITRPPQNHIEGGMAPTLEECLEEGGCYTARR